METWGQFDVRGFRRLWARARACGRVPGSEGGSALVELALVVAVLGVPLLLGVAQMGGLIYDSIEVSDAANAGVMYGMRSSTYAVDNGNIIKAAQDDALDFKTLGVSTLSVSPTTYWVCALAVNGTQYNSSSSASCTGTGNHALQFVQVNTSATITPMIHCPGLPSSLKLTGQSAMEVEQ